MTETWLVSACLLGLQCRYDGAAAKNEAQDRARRLGLGAGIEVVPFCPEVAGGLDVPRPAAELVGGDGLAVLAKKARVLTRDGNDVTAAFVRGAQVAVQVASLHGATGACLKARSPSCGVGVTHIDGAVRDGDGVAAAALRLRGLRVVSDEELFSEGEC